jgi:hypothetical protein
VSLLDQLIGLKILHRAVLVAPETVVWQLVSASSTSVIPTSPVTGRVSFDNCIKTLLGFYGCGLRLTSLELLTLAEDISDLLEQGQDVH